MQIRKVHERNTEINTDEFDAVREQAVLERLTGVSSVKVGVIVGGALVYAMHGGHIGVCHNFSQDPGADGCYVVQYLKGRVLSLDNNAGIPRQWGPFQPRFYHRDRVAEILRLDRESA